MRITFARGGRAVVCAHVRYERPVLGLVREYVVHPTGSCVLDETRAGSNRTLSLRVPGL
jgi:hypothetical protein